MKTKKLMDKKEFYEIPKVKTFTIQPNTNIMVVSGGTPDLNQEYEDWD